MKYSELCEVYEQLEKNPGRIKKTEIISEFLKKLKDKDREVMYLLQGRVWPDYEEREFGISSQLTIKALAKSSGKPESEIIKKWKKIGDLGEVAAEAVGKKSQSTLFSTHLTTDKVIENLKKLPELAGKGTVDKKIGLIAELLASANSIEAKYITRTLLADLRIGVGSGTIRDAIVWARFDKEDKEAYDIVQSAYDKSTDFAVVFEEALKGKSSLKKTRFSPGQPLKVMLALKAESIADGFERVGKPAAIEYKYDGFRMLINKDEKGNIRIFTRRLDEVTNQFPEVKEYVKKYINAKNFIIDSEAVGYNKKTKRYTSFQDISQRIKRKYDIKEMAENLPIEINAFDILYYNDEPLIDEPFEKRSQILRKIVKTEKWKIKTSEQLITSDEKEAEKFYKEALKNGEEGIMIKNLHSPYKPGARVGDMLKFKPASNEFDLVITGAEYGTGKRAGWLSSFDVACRNHDEFLEIGKVSTGLKEKTRDFTSLIKQKETSGVSSQEEGTSYEEMTKLLKPLIIKEEDKHVKIKPKIIITVTYQDIQKSPSYNSGFALRFPRFTALRADRDTHDIAAIKDIEKEFLRRINIKAGPL